ncbi:MAG: hypothetical protein HY069_05035 [Chlamydiia bacterium]|nr:hypothetical protein [Chlamydiia bacterium]
MRYDRSSLNGGLMCDHYTPPQQYVQYLLPAHFQQLASIIKIPPAETSDSSYKSLLCTQEDKDMIDELITTLGENGKLALLTIQSDVRRLGAQINHVHPFKFLAVIFSTPRLKEHMKNNIFSDYFKRNGFMDGLGPSLSREALKGKLHPYIDDFAKEVNVSPDMLRQLFDNRQWSGSDWSNRDWEKLVYFLIES